MLRPVRVLVLACALLAPALVAVAPAGGSSAPPFAWGSDLSPWWSYDPAQRVPALDSAKAVGMARVHVDAKDGWGLAAWSTPDHATFTPFAPGDGAVERVTRDAAARGIAVAARFDAFEDHEAARRFPAASLGGSPAWVDPACADVQRALLAKVRDLVLRTDVSEVNLDHLRYPDVSELPASTPLPCTGGRLGDAPGLRRSEVIAAFARDAAATARAARPGVEVTASVFASAVHGPRHDIGQDLALLAPHLDVLMPMAYPSYYSPAAEADPYGTVRDTTALAVQRFGAAKVRPWVQGFGPYAGDGDAVCRQLRGAVDGGATGAAVWWFASMGTAPGPWKTAAACVPASAPAPAPTTPPPAFTATFTPRPGNAWWVETAVRADAPLAKVQASVDGGAPVDLAPTSWGTWARSFHVPEGAHVRFTAVSTDGRTATSAQAYVWPSATPVEGDAPAPAPAFTATFAKHAAKRHWVEVRVSASLPLSGVTASVDGGAPVALSATSGGTWAKAMRVPHGAKLTFTATATDGQKATSGPFPWP